MDTILRVEFSRLDTTETTVEQASEKLESKYDAPTFATPHPVSRCKLAAAKGSSKPRALDFERETKALVQRQSQTLLTILGGYKIKKVIKDRRGQPKKSKAPTTKRSERTMGLPQTTTTTTPPPEATRTFSPMDLD